LTGPPPQDQAACGPPPPSAAKLHLPSPQWTLLGFYSCFTGNLGAPESPTAARRPRVDRAWDRPGVNGLDPGGSSVALLPPTTPPRLRLHGLRPEWAQGGLSCSYGRSPESRGRGAAQGARLRRSGAASDTPVARRRSWPQQAGRVKVTTGCVRGVILGVCSTGNVRLAGCTREQRLFRRRRVGGWVCLAKAARLVARSTHARVTLCAAAWLGSESEGLLRSA
jgi:hypothetical protein